MNAFNTDCYISLQSHLIINSYTEKLLITILFKYYIINIPPNTIYLIIFTGCTDILVILILLSHCRNIIIIRVYCNYLDHFFTSFPKHSKPLPSFTLFPNSPSKHQIHRSSLPSSITSANSSKQLIPPSPSIISNPRDVFLPIFRSYWGSFSVAGHWVWSIAISLAASDAQLNTTRQDFRQVQYFCFRSGSSQCTSIDTSWLTQTTLCMEAVLQ